MSYLLACLSFAALGAHLSIPVVTECSYTVGRRCVNWERSPHTQLSSSILIKWGLPGKIFTNCIVDLGSVVWLEIVDTIDRDGNRLGKILSRVTKLFYLFSKDPMPISQLSDSL